MSPMFRDEDEEEEDLFGDVSRMADRMGLKGEKRANYIDDHMIGGGYERVQTRESYAKLRSEDKEEEGGGRWGFGRGRSSGGGGGGGGRSRRDDDDDKY